eukprot:GHVR01165229.1.p1 GENE.GHVR01165229.1~~GHVR01165229.1.p1  ORF type:complete len:105 (+),score=45.31 GHVR01165229.1:99-413(+)
MQNIHTHTHTLTLFGTHTHTEETLYKHTHTSTHTGTHTSNYAFSAVEADANFAHTYLPSISLFYKSTPLFYKSTNICPPTHVKHLCSIRVRTSVHLLMSYTSVL